MYEKIIMHMHFVCTRSTLVVCFTKARKTHSTAGISFMGGGGGAPLVFEFYSPPPPPPLPPPMFQSIFSQNNCVVVTTFEADGIYPLCFNTILLHFRLMEHPACSLYMLHV